MLRLSYYCNMLKFIIWYKGRYIQVLSNKLDSESKVFTFANITNFTGNLLKKNTDIQRIAQYIF